MSTAGVSPRDDLSCVDVEKMHTFGELGKALRFMFTECFLMNRDALLASQSRMAAFLILVGADA